jgi:hypothetical protein
MNRFQPKSAPSTANQALEKVRGRPFQMNRIRSQIEKLEKRLPRVPSEAEIRAEEIQFQMLYCVAIILASPQEMTSP